MLHLLALTCLLALICFTAGADDFDDLLQRVRTAPDTSAPSAETAAELDADTADEAVAHRKQLVIEAGAGTERVNWKARSGKHTFDVAACRLKLDPHDETSWGYVPIGMRFREQGDTFGRSELSRIVRQFEPHIPENLREPLREEVVTYPGYLGGGTENHVAMRRTAGLLMGELYPEDSFHHDLTGAELADECLKYMRDYGHAIYDASMVEYLSPIYHAVNTGAWLNVVELADSPRARLTARAVLDWMLLDLAINQVHGAILPPLQRDKGYLTGGYQRSYARANTQWTGWLYWGATDTPQSAEQFMLDKYRPEKPLGTWVRLHSVSDWTPHHVIRNIGAKRLPTPYMLWQSRANWDCVRESHRNDYAWRHQDGGEPNPRYQMRSVYVARDYALSAGYYHRDLTDPILRNHTPCGISWRTDRDDNLLRFVHPYWYTAREHPATTEPLGSDDWLGISPFMRMVHWENAAIVLCDIPRQDPFVEEIPDKGSPKFYSERLPECIQELHFYAPETADECIERDGVVFLREGEVYVAIQPLAGEAHWEDAVWEGWRRLVIPGALTGAAVELGDADEFGSFAAFQRQIVGTEAALVDGVASFRTTRGNELSVAFAEDTWLPRATVNGVLLDFDRWPTCESPYLSVRDRVLDANDGREGIIVDFTGEVPVYEYYELVDGEKRVTSREFAANGEMVRQ